MLRADLRHPASIMLAGIASAALIGLDETPTVIRGAAAVVLVLFLVGYALSIALLPSGRIDAAERLALALGLGMSAVIVDGFVLNLFPSGIDRRSWAASLGAITTVAAAIGWYRAPSVGGRSDIDRQASTGASPAIPRDVRAPARRLMAYAGLLVLAAVAVAVVGLDRQPRPGFTELWLLPGPSESISVGISNHEHALEIYDLELTADGVLVERWASLRLDVGETWTSPVDLRQQGSPGASLRATLVLARDPTTIYREARLELEFITPSTRP